MKRRKFVIGLGALASGTAAAMGTGAFSSVSADRSVSVTVANDSSAYLALDPAGSANGDYADVSDGEVTIDFGSLENNSASGSGVNTNSVTIAESVLTITNQGTQKREVKLSSEGSGSTLQVGDPSGSTSDPSGSTSDDTVYAYLDPDDDAASSGTGEDTDSTDLGEESLGVGESIDVDFAIDVADGTTSLSVGNDLRITADAPE